MCFRFVSSIQSRHSISCGKFGLLIFQHYNVEITCDSSFHGGGTGGLRLLKSKWRGTPKYFIYRIYTYDLKKNKTELV